MQQQQEQRNQRRRADGSEVAAAGFISIICAIAFSAEVWLRRDFGVRYIGSKGLLGFGFIALFASFFPHQEVRPLLVFLCFYSLFWAIAQLSAWYRKFRRKIDGHTRYSGRPHLMRLLPGCGEITVKRLEPFLVILAGYGIHHLNRPLGDLLITAGVALVLTGTLRIAAERERVLDMNDAVAAQRVTADSFRAMQN